MASERCMRIPELVRHICDNLHRKTAFAMTMTCQDFIEPALDSLWFEVDSLNGLIACLPDDLWDEERMIIGPPELPDGLAPRHLTIISPGRMVTREDLEGYKTRYAHRIRVLKAPPAGNYHGAQVLTTDVYMALHLATNAEWGALSPRLRRLEWKDAIYHDGVQQVDAISPFMSLFLAPSATSFHASLRAGFTMNEAAVYHSTRRISQNLEELVLARDPVAGYCDLQKYLTTFEWPNLVRVSMPLTSPLQCCLQALGSMPRLKELSLYIQADVELLYPIGRHIPDEYWKNTSFRSLEELSVLTLHSCTRTLWGFVQHIPPRNALKRVTLTSGTYTSASDTQQLLHLVRAHLNYETLERLIISDGEAISDVHDELEEDEDEARDLPFREGVPNVRILSIFRNLKELVLNVSGGIKLLPADMDALPRAWPHLQLIDFRPSTSPSQTPYLDHDHILQLVRKCPSLKVLGVPFDGTRVTGNESPVRPPEPPCGVEELRTWRSLITSTTRMRRFCAARFPALKRIRPDTIWGYTETPEEKRWRWVAQELGIQDY